MKKMIAIIFVLLIIFISMALYKYVILANNQVTVEDVTKIEQYISKIYGWKEVTKEALPKFENINNADEKWTLEVIKKNLDEYEVTLEGIQNKGKEIFGDNFSKEFKNIIFSFEYNQEKNLYIAKEIITDKEEDLFFINKINKTINGYEVEIIEYIEDYSEFENNKVIIKDINEKTVEVIETNELDTQDINSKTIEILKSNKEKFNSKKLTIKSDNNKIYLQKVEG